MTIVAWADDKLRRQEEAQDLLAFLRGRVEERRRRGLPARYVLNVDSSWGDGKSYFLTNISRDLTARDEIVAMVDAWATDFSEDPLTVIMSSIDAALKPHLASASLKRAWRGVIKAGGTLAVSLAKHAGGKFLNRYVGSFGDDVADSLFITPGNEPDAALSEDPTGLEAATTEAVEKLADSALNKLMEQFRQQEKSIATFKSQLSKLVKALNSESEDSYKSIYILLDELDRCRPTYGLRMLEAVKHLFETEGLVFIIATDTAQLAESVRAVYGAEFDSHRYLRRFFDRTYRFRTPDYAEYIDYLFSRSGIDLEKLSVPHGMEIISVASAILQDFRVSLRDAEQCIDMLHTFCTTWRGVGRIEIGYALALICLYHGGRIEDFEIFSGRKKGSLTAPLFKEPTIILRENTVDSYSGRAQQRTFTTAELVQGYTAGATLSLVHWAEQSPSNDPIVRHIAQIMRSEFSARFSNSYRRDDPPYSQLGDYYRHVILAERLSEPSAG